MEKPALRIFEGFEVPTTHPPKDLKKFDLPFLVYYETPWKRPPSVS